MDSSILFYLAALALIFVLSVVALWRLSVSENARVKALYPFLKKPLQLAIHYIFKELARTVDSVSAEDKKMAADKLSRFVYGSLPYWLRAAVSEDTFIGLVERAFDKIDSEAKEYLSMAEAKFNLRIDGS